MLSKKHPSGAKERGFIVLSASISPPGPHLSVVLAWQQEGDFYFGFSAGGQSSLGCGIGGDIAMFPLAHSSTFQQLLWDRVQHISSSMRNSSRLFRWGATKLCDHVVCKRLKSMQSPTWFVHACKHVLSCRGFYTHTVRYCPVLF